MLLIHASKCTSHNVHRDTHLPFTIWKPHAYTPEESLSTLPLRIKVGKSLIARVAHDVASLETAALD